MLTHRYTGRHKRKRIIKGKGAVVIFSKELPSNETASHFCGESLNDFFIVY